jgi:hypothetical protein
MMRIKRGDCSHSVGRREVKSDAGEIVSKGRSVTVLYCENAGQAALGTVRSEINQMTGSASIL